MLIGWGSYALRKVFKLFPISFCGYCNYYGEMKCMTTARLAHFLFIPFCVFDREYFLICPNCGNAIKISKQDFKSIEKGTWQPPTKDENLLMLNENEIFEKAITYEVKCLIYPKLKQLKDPQTQEAVCLQIKKSFANKYKKNATVEKIVNDTLLAAMSE